jgi:hypothetical protein
MEELQNSGFCGGALYGLLVTAVIAKILNELRVARTQMGRRNQTLDNFPASAQAKLTASGIVSDSQAAGFKYVVLLLALLLVVALSAAGAILILQSRF